MFHSMSRTYPQHLVGDHESVVFDLNPHWIRLAVTCLPAVVVLASGVVVTALVTGTVDGFHGGQALLAIVGLIALASLWCGAQYLIWSRTHFVLTNTRIVVRVGVISKRSTEIPLNRINSVACKQNPFERLVRVGDLYVESASLDGRNIISDVRDPERVRQLISEHSADSRLVSSPQQPRSDPWGAPPEPPARQEDDVATQIRTLAELCDSGIISDTEFAAKKAELLSRI